MLELIDNFNMLDKIGSCVTHHRMLFPDPAIIPKAQSGGHDMNQNGSERYIRFPWIHMSGPISFHS